MAQQSPSEAGTGGPSGVVVAAITAILNAGEQTLTHGRGVIDKEEGFVLRDIDTSLTQAERDALFVETRPAMAKDSLVAEVQALFGELEGAIDFIMPQSFDLPELLEKLSGLLLNPTYDPSKPCLAPAPPLRDLLDVALGRITGGIDAIVTKVGQSAWDLLLPAGVEGDDLGRFVESILADPVTAVLNWILGKKAQIDCVVTGGLAVGEGVLEAQVRRLEEAVAGAFD